MRNFFHTSIFLLISYSLHLFGAEQKDFFLVSIPKSGTHLAVKLLLLLSDREPDPLLTTQQEKREPQLKTFTQNKFDNLLLLCKTGNRFAYNHTDPHFFNAYFMDFSQRNSEYVKLLQIRDLRDVLVSLLYYPDSNDAIIKEMGGNFSKEQKLSHILSRHSDIARVWVEDSIKCMLEWMSLPDAVVLRFEDLIGPKGGGDAGLQERTILELATKLEIPVSQTKLVQITDILFGNSEGPPVSATFRKGCIGSWREHFTPKHIELFNDNWSHYQIALGYPIDD